MNATDACLALAKDGRQILEATRHASDLALRFREGRSGAVGLFGTLIFMDGVVSSMVASCQSKHSEIRIDQSCGYAKEVVSKLEAGALDVGIVPVRKSEVPDGLNTVQILPGRNVIACRSGHPLARKQLVRLPEIAKYPWIGPAR